MKKYILFLIIFSLSFFVFSQVAFADCTSEAMQSHWIECMDYDGASPPSGWPTCLGASWQDWSPLDSDCTNPDYFNPIPGTSALSTSVKYSGTRSLMFIKQAGCHEAMRTDYDWTASYPTVTKVHFRMYINFDSSWNNVGAENVDNYWHIIQLNAAAWTIGIDIGDFTDEKPWNPGICYKSYDSGVWRYGEPYLHPHGMFFRFKDREPSVQVGPTAADHSGCWNIKEHLGEWHAHEWMLEIHNPTEVHWKHWVDGVLMADRINTILASTPPLTRWTSFHLDQWLSTGDGEAHEVKTYFDNIVIATDYIGPMGSPDTTPPAAPTGLAVR